MKRTHKFKEMNDIARVVAKSTDLKSAARALGVDYSTLYRWMKAGKVQRPRSQPPVRVGESAIEAAAKAAPSPKSWEESVKAAYTLSDTDLELVGLAAAALTMTKTAEHERDRLSAMARFQQLVRQLNLDVAGERSAAAPVVSQRPRVVRTGTDDPRARLMAVK